MLLAIVCVLASLRQLKIDVGKRLIDASAGPDTTCDARTLCDGRTDSYIDLSDLSARLSIGRRDIGSVVRP